MEMLTANHKNGIIFCSWQEACVKMQLSGEELGALVHFPVVGACSLSENHKKALKTLAARLMEAERCPESREGARCPGFLSGGGGGRRRAAAGRLRRAVARSGLAALRLCLPAVRRPGRPVLPLRRGQGGLARCVKAGGAVGSRLPHTQLAAVCGECMEPLSRRRSLTPPALSSR